MLMLDKGSMIVFFPYKVKVVEWFLLGSVADVQLLTRRGVLQQNPESRKREEVSMNVFLGRTG